MIEMSSEVVWMVKLPAEWKEVFEKMAEEVGDTERGAAARALRKTVKKALEVKGN